VQGVGRGQGFLCESGIEFHAKKKKKKKEKKKKMTKRVQHWVTIVVALKNNTNFPLMEKITSSKMGGPSATRQKEAGNQ